MAQTLHLFDSDESERLFNYLSGLRRTFRSLLFFRSTNRFAAEPSLVENFSDILFLDAFCLKYFG